MRNQYLQQMGITVWYLRDPLIPDNYFRVALKNTAGITVGLLLAEISKYISLEEQEKLLQKITHALTSNIDQEITLNISFDDIQKNNPSFILILGNTIKINSHCKIIRSFSLFDLIENVEYKKQLWSEIKPLRELLV